MLGRESDEQRVTVNKQALTLCSLISFALVSHALTLVYLGL